MYESIHATASSLSTLQSIIGLALAAIAVQRLGKVAVGRMIWWRGIVDLVYLGLILSLLFFTYAVGLHTLGGGTAA